MNPRNVERAERVSRFIAEYGAECYPGEGVGAFLARDFIADVLHWCQLNGCDPVAAADMALAHYEAERDGE